MPNKIYNNVERHRLIDNGRTVEDVTKVGLPDIKHPTTAIENVAGMAMNVELPNQAQLEACEFTVYHNNGANCEYLCDPGTHEFEFRVARQVYDRTQSTMGHEGNKFRVTGLFVEQQKGDIETGSPYGTTVKYSVLRFEEEKNGEIVEQYDAALGTVMRNGVSCTDEIDRLLN